MFYVPNAVNHRIAHHDVGVGHINLEAQNMSAIGKLAIPHSTEEL
jgi:hypothetical protein